MKVSSPIGDLPFEATHFRLRRGAIELVGAMGAWPARIVIYPRDAPKLLRLFRWPLGAFGMIVVVLLFLVLIG